MDELPSQARWFFIIEMRHRSMIFIGFFDRLADGFSSEIGHFWSIFGRFLVIGLRR